MELGEDLWMAFAALANRSQEYAWRAAFAELRRGLALPAAHPLADRVAEVIVGRGAADAGPARR